VDGKILLRDVVDLEATLGGGGGPDGAAMEAEEEEEAAPAAKVEAKPAKAAEAAPKPEKKKAKDAEPEAEATPAPEELDEEDEANLSLAAMEAQLKPQVLEAFDAIAKHYKKLQKTHEERLQAALVRQEEAQQDLNEAVISLRRLTTLDINTVSVPPNLSSAMAPSVEDAVGQARTEHPLVREADIELKDRD